MKKFLVIISLILAVVLICCSCNSRNHETTDSENTARAAIPAPENITANIIGIYPHDTSAYTQGLQLYNGKLYEGTGDYETSSLRVTDIKSGKVEKKHVMGTTE